MDVSILAAIIVVVLVILLISGLPIVFIMGGMAALGLFILEGPQAMNLVASQAFSQMDNFVTIAIPLFIFMGTLLERSGIAEDAFDLMYKTLGAIRGGLAVGSVVVCTIFAAMTGTAAAATIAMGLIALPAMRKHDYDIHLAMGSIAASGTLGVLIPPSVLMVLYALFANESVGQMFAGGVFAGVFMAGTFVVYILVRSLFQPKLCPALPKEERSNIKEIFFASKGLILPIAIIVIVLGTIFAGIATPTEAAAVGCVGTLICTAIRRTLTVKVAKQVTTRTLQLSAMVVWIIFGSAAFTSFFAKVGAIQIIQDLMLNLAVTPYVVIAVIMLVLFILGMFIDPGAIIMLTVPIFVPVIKELGFDSLWFGVVFVANMQTGYITPPFGFNLFYMKQIVPKGIVMKDIYMGVIPFVALMIFCVIIFIAFPDLILWLPGVLFGN